MKKNELEKIRELVADYMYSEGCSCCQNTDAHDETKKELAKILKVPKWKDGSGFNFGKFRKDK